MKALSFSIIIPTYNRAEQLRTTLEWVAALSVPDEWTGEVLVVDNSSPDQTAAVVESLQGFPLPLRRVVESKQGLNHARNRGIREGTGDWLIYLDDDIKVAPGWLHGLAEAVLRFQPDAVAGPVFPWFEGETPPWCVGPVLDSVTSAYSRKGERTQLLPSDRAHELPGCNFAVRRALALELGGFHPTLDRAGAHMLAGGDFEFGMRLADRGARCLYVPGCGVQHLISRRKMSRAGLKERWRGLGATAKAIRAIRARPISLLARCHLYLRMLRLRCRGLLFAVRSADAAFQWELEATRLRGFLFGRLEEPTVR